ncbi:RE1-silencing transcription factor isoform X1 [Lates japonicus]|uniref:RE1-silencing transcription factor isoform X1 n=1 Tax=Lates japonicus TaxID=270547 RepID=A0AAD3N9V8_LATJO|nr:RE1-silencing transcription factor isoform X1 [Lates japonicus]
MMVVNRVEGRSNTKTKEAETPESQAPSGGKRMAAGRQEPLRQQSDIRLIGCLYCDYSSSEKPTDPTREEDSLPAEGSLSNLPKTHAIPSLWVAPESQPNQTREPEETDEDHSSHEGSDISDSV